MTATRSVVLSALFASALLAACAPTGTEPMKPNSITAANHRWFPLTAGAVHEFGKVAGPDGAITCDSCHRPTAESFTAVRCDQCHKHTERLTQRLHLAIPASFNVDTSAVSDPDLKAELRGANCYKCHADGQKRAFSHTQIVDQCAECHAEGNAFAALPKAGFTHPQVGASDCAGCHVTTSWKGAGSAPNDASDPARDVLVTAKLPTFAGTTIDQVTDLEQRLPMPMNHSASALDAGMLTDCAACHVEASSGVYKFGQLHWSLDNAAQPQPARCSECHAKSRPIGFVGPLTSPFPRSPATGGMRHDAVAWANGAPTTTRLVPDDCAGCHGPPDPSGATTWRVALDGGSARFHASLTASGRPQPASCLDCHANTRPTALLTSSNAALPAGMTFDHQAGNALGDCASCHSSTSTWVGGAFHAGTPTPSACLPCHAAQRPRSTAGWTSTTYTRSPFDYGDTVVNGQTVTHGAGEDCALCHSSSTQTWVGGNFFHGPPNLPTPLAAAGCISCHFTQRPAAAVPRPSPQTPFDHASGGMGDCRACHQATVRAGTYVNLLPIPGGDWKGGVEYPADVPVTSSQFLAITGLRLTRSASAFVTGVTSQSTNFYNAMLHTSTQVPSAVFPGPASAPVNSSCWHCHTHPAGSTTVSSFSNGKFHQALQSYTANVDGTGAMVLAQPTRCRDCHEQMRPNLVIQKGGSPLQPMDHSISFTAPVTINGQSHTGVASMDCVACHKASPVPGTLWSNGQFHANIGAGVPSDCTGCHYPLSATPSANVTSAPTFAMKHQSPSLGTTPLQRCETCHLGALANGAATPIAATLWRTPGAAPSYHAHVTPQPGACLECHKVSQPAAATQGTSVYTLSQGSTATNGAQWMNHAVASVVSLDCATCHRNDAKVTGSAWNRGPALHANQSPGTCSVCHGTGNGRGATVGTNNNLPSGLTDTRSTTTASMWPGRKDQLTHGDLNVTARDCNACHTQSGRSTAAGVQGVEWKQAAFHRNFTAANPLLLNGTSARCSNCHVNVKPGAGFSPDHAAFTATSAQDCSGCHALPGTGTAAAPNWKGATGSHASSGPTSASTLDCSTCHGQGGSSSTRLAVPAASHYGGVANGNKCTSCHINFTGFKDTVSNLKYGHSNATANAGSCSACHAFSNQLYTTLTNTPALTLPTAAGGHQFSQARSVTGTFNGDSFNSPHTNTKMQLCGNCHQYSATTAATNVWTFRHRPSNPGLSASKSSGGCNMCH